jgi:GDP-L-fucose synthase
MRSLILGHRGMVGSAIHRIVPDAETWHRSVDLRTDKLYPDTMRGVDVLYLCAARVGGIQRNIDEPGSMIYDNLMIQANVIEAARIAGVKLVVFLGSSCIYPARQSILTESDLLTGPLESTNESYAVAKIAGIKMLETYRRQYGMEYLAVMPCNLYGPGDNFHAERSHFLPGMIRRFHMAKTNNLRSVTLWGTGTPRRELMHVDDCARIIVELAHKGARGLINIGPGVDETIEFYAHHVRCAAGASYIPIEWDHSKPDGTTRKLMDVSRMRSYGVGPQISLTDGLASAYRWFMENVA